MRHTVGVGVSQGGVGKHQLSFHPADMWRPHRPRADQLADGERLRGEAAGRRQHRSTRPTPPPRRRPALPRRAGWPATAGERGNHRPSASVKRPCGKRAQSSSASQRSWRVPGASVRRRIRRAASRDRELVSGDHGADQRHPSPRGGPGSRVAADHAHEGERPRRRARRRDYDDRRSRALPPDAARRPLPASLCRDGQELLPPTAARGRKRDDPRSRCGSTRSRYPARTESSEPGRTDHAASSALRHHRRGSRSAVAVLREGVRVEDHPLGRRRADGLLADRDRRVAAGHRRRPQPPHGGRRARHDQHDRRRLARRCDGRRKASPAARSSRTGCRSPASAGSRRSPTPRATASGSCSPTSRPAEPTQRSTQPLDLERVGRRTTLTGRSAPTTSWKAVAMRSPSSWRRAFVPVGRSKRSTSIRATAGLVAGGRQHRDEVDGRRVDRHLGQARERRCDRGLERVEVVARPQVERRDPRHRYSVEYFGWAFSPRIRATAWFAASAASEKPTVISVILPS